MPRTMSLLMLAVVVLVPAGAAIGELPPDLEVYLADARLSPGKVFQVTQRSFPFPRQVYERPAGGLHAVAVGPDGRLYFTDANQFDILRTDGLGEERVFRHTTYVRDLAFDSHGRLFFSQATGAGGDGMIFRLDLATGRATPFRTVRLAQVGGFWAGHFAFDRSDRLYLSSGNQVPAAFYAEAGGRFERRYPFDEPITGFAFLDARKLFFTNHRQTLYQLEGFSTRSELLSRSSFTWLNDVALARTPAAGSGPCSISGRLVGGEDLWRFTSVNLFGPDLFWRWVVEGIRIGAGGTYSFRGLPRGRYWVQTDIRADVGGSFEPRRREVRCTGAVTGIDFRWSR